MYLKTTIWLALVLVITLGMGCGAGTGTQSGTGTGGDPSLYGTWNLVSSSGGAYPASITLNSNGTGTYTGNNFNSNINWSQSGNTVTITAGAASQPAYINNLTFPVGNTFTLNGISGAGVYTRG